jgi:hypothetical protein
LGVMVAMPVKSSDESIRLMFKFSLLWGVLKLELTNEVRIKLLEIDEPWLDNFIMLVFALLCEIKPLSH